MDEAGADTVEWTPSGVHIVSDGVGGTGLSQTNLAVGETFDFEMDVTLVSGQLKCNVGGSNEVIFTESGRYAFSFDITGAGTMFLYRVDGEAGDGYFDNVVAKQPLGLRDPITGAYWFLEPDDSIIVIAPVFLNGLPIDGLAAVYTADNGTVEYYSQGMPFDSGGRLVITTTGDIDHHGAGATPYDAAGRLCVAGETDLIYMGIAFAEGGKFASS